MYRIFQIIILISLCFLSCDNDKQYNVYAINQTHGDISVSISSSNYSSPIVLAPNERKMIISTDLIETDQIRTQAEDCKLVASDITAHNSVGKQSSVKWCSDDVSFAVVDIGQGEFTITYKEEDF